jgi:hypothetical protein
MLGRLMRTEWRRVPGAGGSDGEVGAGSGDSDAGAAEARDLATSIPDGIGHQALIGWRAWRIIETNRGLRLSSPMRGFQWQPGWQNTAACSSCAHDPARSSQCGCGFNAVKHRRQLEPYGLAPVVGEVELAGEVRQFRKGYRSEQARPLRLHLRRGQEALAQQLRDTYEIDVITDRPRLITVAIQLALIAAISYLSFKLLADHSANALLAGQADTIARRAEEAIMVTAVIGGAAAWCWRGLFSRAYLCCACAFFVFAGFTVGDAGTTPGSYTEDLRAVRTTHHSRTVKLTAANAHSYVDAAGIRPGSCHDATRLLGGSAVHVCRRGRTLRLSWRG